MLLAVGAALPRQAAAQGLQLLVDPVTLETSLFSPSGFLLQAYLLTSEKALDPLEPSQFRLTPDDWVSLTSRSFGGFIEVGTINEGQIGEIDVNLTPIPANSPISIGFPFGRADDPLGPQGALIPALGLGGDALFQFNSSGATVFLGDIVLLPGPEPDGDLSGDGAYSILDYPLLRDLIGSDATLDDYDDWRANFEATSAGSSVSQAAVPEPGAAMVFANGLLTLAAARRVASRRS